MKKKGHPPYQEILFVDTATGTKFVCGSTLQPSATELYEGKEYPVYYVPISSASHPFFTGSQKLVDAEGRIDKFKKRYAKTSVAHRPVAQHAPYTKMASKKTTLRKKTDLRKKKDTKS